MRARSCFDGCCATFCTLESPWSPEKTCVLIQKPSFQGGVAEKQVLQSWTARLSRGLLICTESSLLLKCLLQDSVATAAGRVFCAGRFMLRPGTAFQFLIDSRHLASPSEQKTHARWPHLCSLALREVLLSASWGPRFSLGSFGEGLTDSVCLIGPPRSAILIWKQRQPEGGSQLQGALSSRSQLSSLSRAVFRE